MRRTPALAALAALVGIVLGAAMRTVPATIAGSLTSGPSPPPCGIEAAVECAFRDLPDAIGVLIKFGLILFALSGAMAIAGVVVVAVAARRLRHGTDVSGAHMAARLAAITAGTALVVPPLFLLVSFVAFLLTK